MRQKLRTGLGAILVVGLVAGCAGHGHATRWGKHGGWYGKSSSQQSLHHLFVKKSHMILHHRTALSLSDEQVDAIKTLKRETDKTVITQKADAAIIAIDLMAALKADEVDSRRVNQLIDKQYAIKGEKAKTYADAYTQLKNTLSSSQKQQLKALWRSKGQSKGKCSKAGCPLCRR